MTTAKTQAIRIECIKNDETKIEYKGFTIHKEWGTSKTNRTRNVYTAYDCYGKLVCSSSTIKKCKSEIERMLVWGSSAAPIHESFWA